MSYYLCMETHHSNGYEDPLIRKGNVYKGGPVYEAAGIEFVKIQLCDGKTGEIVPGAPEIERPAHLFTQVDSAFPQSDSRIHDGFIKSVTKVTEGRKDDSDKTRWDLMPWGPLSEVADVMTYGARNYADNNWQQVQSPRARYTAAMVRHMVAWFNGQDRDPESGHHHLAHAVCCALFLIHFEKKGYRP